MSRASMHRRAIRRAERSLGKATRAAARTVAASPAPATAEENATLARIMALLEARQDEVLAAVDGITDPAMYALVPDADDIRMMQAAADVAALNGDSEARGRIADFAVGRASFFPFERPTLAAWLESTGWTRQEMELLRAPPLGSVPIVYDGTATGHGVFLLGVRTALGGAA